jgi:hypothetical protein
MKGIAITLVLLLVTGALAYVSFSSGRARDAEPRDAAPPAEVGPPRNEVALEPQARLPVEPEKSLGSALADYWGADWPAMEGRYAQANVDLGASLATSDWKPWKEVEAETQAAARSIHERDRDFVRKTFLSRLEETDGFLAQLGITEENEAERLPQLKAAVAPIDVELEVLSVQYMRQLDRAMERAFERGPEKYPLVDLRGQDRDMSPEEMATRPFKSIQVEKGGWYVAYGLRWADCPELAEIEKQQNELVKRRLETLRSTSKELARAGR